MSFWGRFDSQSILETSTTNLKYLDQNEFLLPGKIEFFHIAHDLVIFGCEVFKLIFELVNEIHFRAFVFSFHSEDKPNRM